MSVATKVITVALLGNPNTGKSSLFNALSGIHQRVGNYPGVTVEKKVGRARFHEREFSLIDLPGTYSLSPRSPDEMIAVDVLLHRREDVAAIDVVLCIVDATNLERNLYLVSQVLELGCPVVVALNMTDLAEQRGIQIDLDRLRQQLPVTIVPTQANKGRGLMALKQALLDAAGEKVGTRESPFPAAFQAEVAQLGERQGSTGGERLPRFLVERLLLDVGGYVERSAMGGIDQPWLREVYAARQRLESAGLPVPAVEAMSRYQWAARVLEGVVQRPAHGTVSWTDRIDRVLTHKLFGTLTFVALMFLVFQVVFLIADPASAAIDWLNGQLTGVVESLLGEGALRSLLTKGVIDGVGGVLVFLPQIFALFLFIAVLEDCGYMARAAYLMDKLMSRVGLSGKSFIPLLSSFACAIPGIMATRVIENRRDRLVTILVAPLMSCSARLPVYTLLITAFLPNRGLIRGVTLLAMYAIGMVTAIVVALVLKRTLLRGGTPPFVMELPEYKIPSIKLVVHRMLDRGWSFVRRAGTLILAVSIVVWAAAYFPHDPGAIDPALWLSKQRLTEQLADLERRPLPSGEAANDAGSASPREELQQRLDSVNNQIAGQYLQNSYLGTVGRLIEPAVKPLGWDWRIGAAAIASFPAREVIVATLGIVYQLGEDEDEGSQRLHETLRQATWDGTNRPVFNTPVALSIMVFFALCAQCAATLVVIRRETNSWRWPVFCFVYMTMLAYGGALLTYQVGMWLVG